MQAKWCWLVADMLATRQMGPARMALDTPGEQIWARNQTDFFKGSS
ncbi:hypothetical protein HMPREF9622_02217 [Cutibacterium modestum HL037PA3]|uniref:Uncharacterized protein n=2 Tax=Cutibacterium modestum TaxID=2559073 RepID=A0AAD1KRY5_9ACTN|nr:hypothetical protein HMPREF9621_01950 [Cutibacterium modestum HL037PA2]EFS91058.1 hypothetical protein HMPREF9607_02897 [Cutibacterium modestum HL044PA1]EFT14758.1 hypothetical protein HMPREF9622_02217 [Cutibacterium modestum HL037PA3]BCY25906.1 hypothetical protein KB1_18960 [Cutibacterium modestum]